MIWRGSSFVLALAAASVALAGLAQSASAIGFSDPITVSESPPYRSLRDVVVAPDGVATVVVSESGILLARIEPDGSVGPLTAVPSVAASRASAEVDGDGVVTVAWIGGSKDERHVQYVRVAADGTAGEVQDLPAAESVEFLSTAIDELGRVHLVWTESDGGRESSVFEAELTAGGAIDVAQTISDRRERARWPKIAVDASGQATIAWNACPADPDKWRCGIRTVTVDRQGRTSTDRLIFDPKNRNAYGVMDVSPGRLAIEKTHRRRHIHALFARMSVQFVDLADGRTPATKTLSAWFGTYQTGGIRPQIVTSSAGRSVLAWNNFHRIDAVRIGPGGHISDPFTLSKEGERTTGLEVVMDGLGRTTLLWRGRDTIETANLDDHGRIAGSSTVLEDAPYAFQPIVGVNDSGATAVLWSDSFGIFASVGQ